MCEKAPSPVTEDSNILGVLYSIIHLPSIIDNWLKDFGFFMYGVRLTFYKQNISHQSIY